MKRRNSSTTFSNEETLELDSAKMLCTSPSGEPSAKSLAARIDTTRRRIVENATEKSRSDDSNQKQASPTWNFSSTLSQIFQPSTQQPIHDEAHLERVVRFFRENQILHEGTFREMVKQRQPQAMELWVSIASDLNLSKILDHATKVIQFEHPSTTFSERLKMLPRTSTLDEALATIYCQNFQRLLKYNNLPWQTWRKIFTLLNTQGPNVQKRRCVYFKGPVSCGKSSILRLLTSPYDKNEIGKFGPQSLNSQFWLDDLVGKQIYVGDEALATPLNINTYLLLLEGNPDLCTEVKYGGKKHLEPQNVLMASNNWIWNTCNAYADGIKARCLIIEFIKTCPRGLDIRPPDRLLRLITRMMYNAYVKE